MPKLRSTSTNPDGASGRTALFLYVVLVVLPAVVFGGLLWRQLQQYQNSQLAELPLECRDAAQRLESACAASVTSLLNDEMPRNFEEYSREYYADDLGPVRPVASELATGRPRVGVLGYFSFTVTDDALASEEGTSVYVLRGTPDGEADETAEMLRRRVRDELLDPILGGAPFPAQIARDEALVEGFAETRQRLIRAVVLNFASGEHKECVQALQDAEELRENVTHPVQLQYFELSQLEGDDAGPPLVLATRKVTTDRIDLPLPACIDAINKDSLIVQGFAIDPEWLYRAMPRVEAAQALGPSLRLVTGSLSLEPDMDLAIEPVQVLAPFGMDNGATAYAPSQLHVVADAGALRRSFRNQNAWFGSMALILTISMVIGIRLLLGSIRQSRNEAERTRNFVASVTHELRTPIAAVKLYGEMLRDGWVSDETRRAEYLGRIVNESDRLGGLVDRVLLRRRLYDLSGTPQLADLNAEIQALKGDLVLVGGREVGDVAFELGEGLPQVYVLPEGVHVVLQNLVENARKYAPVEVLADGSPSGEPILVRTRQSRKGRVLLEVLDRGPGIPEKDRSRIFEAFLRLGDEQTRSTKGTGLGLHLVALQARAMRARIRALPREGGGTVFQVTFAG